MLHGRASPFPRMFSLSSNPVLALGCGGGGGGGGGGGVGGGGWSGGSVGGSIVCFVCVRAHMCAFVVVSVCTRRVTQSPVRQRSCHTCEPLLLRCVRPRYLAPRYFPASVSPAVLLAQVPLRPAANVCTAHPPVPHAPICVDRVFSVSAVPPRGSVQLPLLLAGAAACAHALCGALVGRMGSAASALFEATGRVTDMHGDTVRLLTLLLVLLGRQQPEWLTAPHGLPLPAAAAGACRRHGYPPCPPARLPHDRCCPLREGWGPTVAAARGRGALLRGSMMIGVGSKWRVIAMFVRARGGQRVHSSVGLTTTWPPSGCWRRVSPPWTSCRRRCRIWLPLAGAPPLGSW
jgi:hypothetical protein